MRLTSTSCCLDRQTHDAVRLGGRLPCLHAEVTAREDQMALARPAPSAVDGHSPATAPRVVGGRSASRPGCLVADLAIHRHPRRFSEIATPWPARSCRAWRAACARRNSAPRALHLRDHLPAIRPDRRTRRGARRCGVRCSARLGEAASACELWRAVVARLIGCDKRGELVPQ